MATLRLLIKRPGRSHTCIPVTVQESDHIGNCIASLVDHLGFPRRDGQGNMLSYSLRPLSGDRPLPNSLRFTDAHLLPETRLVLEAQKGSRIMQEAGSGKPASTVVGRATMATSPTVPSPQIVSRRTFLTGSVLTGCALSGLLSGVATAFATRKPTLAVAVTPPAVPSRQTPAMLQQALLFSGHQQTVRAVSWSPDGTMIASGADDGWVLLWTPDGQIHQQIPHPAGVTALAWSPDGQRLASGSGQSVRFFDGRTAARLAPARSVHTAQVTSLAWSSASGHPLVSGSLDQRAIVWETQDYQPQAIFSHHTAAIDALSCLPGSTTVASASLGGVIRVWNVDTLAELHGFYQDAPIPMHTVAFVPTGNQLAVGGNDGLVRIWSNGLACQQPTITTQGTFCTDVPLRFRAHTAPVRSLSWSPDAQSLATGGDDGTLAIWAYTPGRMPILVTRTTSPDPVVAVAWSPLHTQIAAASGKSVTIWNLLG